jgi:hypothetical protein
MALVLEDEALRQSYVESGLERARSFGWGTAAGILEDAYRHALETTL